MVSTSLNYLAVKLILYLRIISGKIKSFLKQLIKFSFCKTLILKYLIFKSIYLNLELIII